MIKRLPGKLYRILETLESTAQETLRLFEAIAVAGYGASSLKIKRAQERLRSQHERAEQLALEKQRFYSILSKLKREGFITKTKRGWGLTKAGGEKLQRLRLKWRPSYGNLPQEKTVKIIAYDVPERERRKRHWLRLALIDLGFTLLQRSVWVGTTLLPQEFFDDLRHANLVSCVQIFMISKTGTLKQLN